MGKIPRARRAVNSLGIAGDVTEIAIHLIKPAPENKSLYRPISKNDPDIIALAKSIGKHGVMDPIVASRDGFIISGHRRHMGAKVAGLRTVPVRTVDVCRGDPDFVPLLREFNRQRVKTLAEVAREEIVSTSPDEAHRVLTEFRRKQAQVEVDGIAITGTMHRARITDAKQPLLQAVLAVLDERREFWPLSVRQIHYLLLNAPPLIHASKKKSRYRNNRASYKAAIDIAGRGRLAGLIPWNAIDDETRPITTWSVFDSVAPFMRRELDGFLKGYYRDLLKSQPNQIEIVGEKNTVASIIRPVAMEYCIPFTIGRGYSSLPPRHKMRQRFIESGKDRLILLVLSDHDPEGHDIPHSFARSMRDDFGIENITAIKVGLTASQVASLQLQPNNLEDKKKGSRYKEFVMLHGSSGYEMEAAPPAYLQAELRKAINSVLDRRAFNAEIDAEKQDAAYLDGIRRAVHAQLAELELDGPIGP